MKLNNFFIFLFFFSLSNLCEETIEEKIKRLSYQVVEIAKKESGIKDKIALLQKRINLSQVVMQKLNSEKMRIEVQLITLNKEKEELHKEEIEIKNYFQARMKLLYLSGVLTTFRTYLVSESSEDFMNCNTLLTFVAKKDMLQLNKLKLTKEKIYEKEKELLEKAENLKNVERELILEEKTLNEELKKLKEILQELSKNGELTKRSLEEAIENAKRMDKFFNEEELRKRIEVYGKSIKSKKGKLKKPVEGVIAQGFGDYMHPKFRTFLPHPGLDFKASLGTPVKTIFDGEVLYADWLNGYGYTVIILHPENVYSLYSFLDRIEVRIGELIREGQVIGYSGGDPLKGYSGIYFEIREGKKPVNPVEWILME